MVLKEAELWRLARRLPADAPILYLPATNGEQWAAPKADRSVASPAGALANDRFRTRSGRPTPATRP